ncbi:hypothetical protein I4U23_016209 [Adineta vaga]|nr:hypothetical protein I4U23_016209 [Adineta vaga]
MSFVFICQQIIVYSGIILLIFGIIGNTINIYIFSSVTTYRQTPTTFYFIIESIFKTIFLVINLLPRSISYSYGYDFVNISWFWCKLRQTLVIMSSTVSITAICLSTIDQYLITSSKPSLRQMSQMKISYRIVIIVIILCCFHSTPFYLYTGILPYVNLCTGINPTFNRYIPIFYLVIICIIPILTMIMFAFLTYRNIRQTRVLAEQRADRQLIKMTFLQIILSFFYCIPLASLYAYLIITTEDVRSPDRLSKEYYAHAIISTEVSIYHAASFYVFFFSSNRFRRTVIGRRLGRRHINVIDPTLHT